MQQRTQYLGKSQVSYPPIAALSPYPPVHGSWAKEAQKKQRLVDPILSAMRNGSEGKHGGICLGAKQRELSPFRKSASRRSELARQCGWRWEIPVWSWMGTEGQGMSATACNPGSIWTGQSQRQHGYGICDNFGRRYSIFFSLPCVSCGPGFEMMIPLSFWAIFRGLQVFR